MNLGQAKERVIDLIRERSNAGNLISTGQNQDYYLTMNSYFNEAQMLIATTQKKINAIYQVTQTEFDSVTGENGYKQFKHVGGVDYTVEATAGKSYTFEADKTHTVYIEEETSPGVWTILDTKNGVSTVGTGFTQYKGLIVASVPTNKVRLRFSGDYAYNYRYFDLFTENYATVDDIPSKTPFNFHQMPTDFYQLQEIAFSHDFLQYDLYGKYKYNDKASKRVQIGFPWYESGQFEIRYYRYPTAFPIDYSNPTAYDTMEFDIDDEAVEIALLLVASKVKIDEDAYMSSKFEQEFYIKLNGLSNKENQGLETVTDVNGWV